MAIILSCGLVRMSQGTVEDGKNLVKQEGGVGVFLIDNDKWISLPWLWSEHWSLRRQESERSIRTLNGSHAWL